MARSSWRKDKQERSEGQTAEGVIGYGGTRMKMRFSVVIPQAFYDLIARVAPGFFFLMVLLLALPREVQGVLALGRGPGGNAVESLGHGIVYAGLCYFLGWVFLAFRWASKEGPTKSRYEEKHGLKSESKRNSKSLNYMYQWIRLAHPAAGFRIVKLRAEARMLETSRTAMVVAAGIIAVCRHGCFLHSCHEWGSIGPAGGACIRAVLGLVLALVAVAAFRRCEEKAWTQYWGNIESVYKLLHNRADPVV